MILTKKYRLIFKDKKVLVSGEFSTGSKTYVGTGKTGLEFDSEQELEEYIIDNNLVIDDDDL